MSKIVGLLALAIAAAQGHSIQTRQAGSGLIVVTAYQGTQCLLPAGSSLIWDGDCAV